MSTLDTKRLSRRKSLAILRGAGQSPLKTALIYLVASCFCALFGAVYEIFSHGVFSAFMVFAFLIPLLGGFLPFLLLYLTATSKSRASRKTEEQQLKTVQGIDIVSRKKETGRKRGSEYPGTASRSLYHCGIIAFTIGSIMTGVLDVYGTTNGLTTAYWISGALLLLSGILIHLIQIFTRSVKGSYPCH